MGDRVEADALGEVDQVDRRQLPGIEEAVALQALGQDAAPAGAALFPRPQQAEPRAVLLEEQDVVDVGRLAGVERDRQDVELGAPAPGLGAREGDVGEEGRDAARRVLLVIGHPPAGLVLPQARLEARLERGQVDEPGPGPVQGGDRGGMDRHSPERELARHVGRRGAPARRGQRRQRDHCNCLHFHWGRTSATELILTFYIKTTSFFQFGGGEIHQFWGQK